MKSIYVYLTLLSFLFAGCSSSKTNSTNVPTENMNLVDTYWKLTELNGQSIPDPEEGNKEMHMILKSQDNAMTAFGGCNGLGGKYETNTGNSIHFSNMISTMMACPQLDKENEFKKALDMADNYTISGDVLSLNKAKMAPLARFKAVKK